MCLFVLNTNISLWIALPAATSAMSHSLVSKILSVFMFAHSASLVSDLMNVKHVYELCASVRLLTLDCLLLVSFSGIFSLGCCLLLNARDNFRWQHLVCLRRGLVHGERH